MGKKIIMWINLCIVVLSLNGCQRSENYVLMEESKNEVLQIYEENDMEIQGEKSELANLKELHLKEYILEEWRIEKINEPAGIVYLNEKFFISDRDKDCIFQVDMVGNVIKKVGETGSAEGEFLSPGAMAVYDNEIYIVDQGNNRVQIMDNDLNYLREIKLKETNVNDPNYTPSMIAVNEDGVYVTGISLENSVIDRYTMNGYEELGSNFIGSLFANKEELFLVNSMVRYYDEENDSFGAVTTGPEWLMTLKEDELEKICELPQGFFITNFIVEDERIVCVSAAAAAIYSLDLNGEYKETITYISGLENEESPQIISNQNVYYIVLPNTGKIFRCY